MQRWLRHRREFLLEELAAYRRVVAVVLTGLVILFIYSLRFLRLWIRLFHVFSQ